MNVVLYSTHCPKCNVIEAKLQRKNISPFKVVDNVDEVTKFGEAHGILSAPILEVDGVVMDFKKANEWVNGVK